MTPERRTIEGDGVTLAAWEQGAGPTVVLVHGYPDTHRVWDGVAADLAVDHHVVTYDVRGAGASDAPEGREGYDLEHLVADLQAVVDATSPQAPVHLVGHDWGSIQGWAAVTRPELAGRFSSYTSISGPPLGHAARWMREHSTLRWSALRDLVRQGSRSWYVAFFQLPVLPDVAWRTVVPKAMDRFLGTVEGVPDHARPADTLPRDGRNGLELYRRNVGSGLRAPRPAVTDVPVLLLVPTGDRYVTPALLDGIERCATELTREEVDGGHWVVASEPGRIAGSIRRHVRRAS